MARDFTLRKYCELCETLHDLGYRILTVRDYLRAGGAETPEPMAILRHDVDRWPGNALRMARIEQHLGISSTYYFRMTRHVFRPQLIAQIAEIGHEVGYHYETLAKARGDVSKAMRLFEAELTRLRQLAPIDTAAMHGSPLSRWSNLDLWKHRSPGDLGLIGEPHLDLDCGSIVYLTDTGRSWAETAANVRDRLGSSAAASRLDTTHSLTQHLCASLPSPVMVSAHPERWHDVAWRHALSLALDVCANTLKPVVAGPGRASGTAVRP